MNKFKKNDGFTSVELITVIAVLAAIAYLVLPLVFPSESKTPKQYVENDLTNISEILKIRTLTSEVNGIPINEMYIGNLGVYASRAQVKHAIKINPKDETLTYCLRGEYRGEVLYFESTSGILSIPSGTMDCPGIPATSSAPGEIAPEVPTDGVPQPETPTTEAPVTNN